MQNLLGVKASAWKSLCVRAAVCVYKGFYVQKLLCVKAKGFCVERCLCVKASVWKNLSVPSFSV